MTGEQQVGKPPTQTQDSVPLHRFNEIYQRVKSLEEQNQNYRQTIDSYVLEMNRQRQAAQQPQSQQIEESPFEKPVQQALEKIIEQRIRQHVEPLAQQFRGNLGQLADQQDRVGFVSQYGADVFTKHGEKINQIRDARLRNGQWTTHEEAYKFILADEFGRQAKPKAQTQTQQAPAIDPYTGQQTQTQQAVQPVAPQAPVQAQENFDLPPQGITQSTEQIPITQSTPKLSLGMSEKELENWAGNYKEAKF